MLDFIWNISIIAVIISPNLFVLFAYNLQVNIAAYTPTTKNETRYIQYKNLNKQLISFQELASKNRTFNPSTNDLMVLLHIQKTGGTAFEKNLVHNLETEYPCSCKEEKRRCYCHRPNIKRAINSYIDTTWLISRFATGWICGLHADWTQLSYCLQGLDNIFLLTFLRHPLYRFVSEYRHVQRGATWLSSKNRCESQSTRTCYGTRPDWQNVSLEEFMSCSNNMAINRQTRMLADRHSFACGYLLNEDPFARDEFVLASAMSNLENMAFFGLCEEQRVSQVVFEKTFNLNFKSDFKQSDDNQTKILIHNLPKHVRRKILELNHLDIKLYQFANNLLRSRCRQLMGECERFFSKQSSDI